eukprot:15349748-Ditylum_brightwellii.AAC.1
MSIIHPSEVNVFGTNDHIGFEFIYKDKYEVPKKVIGVNKATGKLLLEYVHGGLELVDANTIQEALLSRNQREDADGPWAFSKVLDHRTVENR